MCASSLSSDQPLHAQPPAPLGHPADPFRAIAAVGGVGVDLGEFEYVKSGRFGYWLGESYWGRGIMTSVVQATSDYALGHLGIVRLEASVFEWNQASMRVLEKCGFVREGLLRRSIFKDGEIIDSVMYARVI